MSIDVRVYLVTDPACPDLGGMLEAAVDGGVTCIQVRDKQATSGDRARTARRLRALVAGRVPVLVDDDLAAARDVQGLHVGPADLPPAQARVALGPAALIGWSVETVAQLDDDEQLAACDYVAASPVWATPTKTDADRPLGLEGVRALAARLGGRLPLVAIGGIDADNAADVIAAGADGIAVVRAIVFAPDPAGAARELRAVVDDALARRGAS
jgi:thiamine-phosphate pyrophosphorylase